MINRVEIRAISMNHQPIETDNKKYRVLLIEDDKVCQMAFIRTVKLDNLPYDYTIAGSVSEAITALESSKFDIVISDYNLGDGTAFDIFNYILDTPIILVTGAGSEEVAVLAMKEGTYDYLIKDPQGNYLKYLPMVVENAIKYKNAEDQFRMLSQAIMSISDSVYITNIHGHIIFVNKAFLETYRYDEEYILGKECHILFKDSIGNVKNILSEIRNGRGKCECFHKRKDGSEFPVSLSKSVIKDESDQDIAIVGVARDITERKQFEEKLRRLSFMDGLTGVGNRRSFDESFLLEWRRGLRDITPLSLIMIDVDYFKAYNDTYGHQAGDDCLKLIATTISDAVNRAGDYVFRYGGEEFVVILSNTDREGATRLAESLRVSVEKIKIPHAKSEINNQITISLGVATAIPTNDFSHGKLILHADKALYKAKQEGRNRVTLSNTVS